LWKQIVNRVSESVRPPVRCRVNNNINCTTWRIDAAGGTKAQFVEHFAHDRRSLSAVGWNQWWAGAIAQARFSVMKQKINDPVARTTLLDLDQASF